VECACKLCLATVASEALGMVKAFANLHGGTLNDEAALGTLVLFRLWLCLLNVEARIQCTAILRFQTGEGASTTREDSKICKLADKAVMASSGFQADVNALQKHLAARHLTYQHQHNKQMSCPAMAQLLSNTLYYKRFFPYYAFNVLGGLDSEGKGCVFTYDAVGSYERVGYSSQGSGSTLIMPFLDNQLKSPSPLLLPAQDAVTPLSESEAVDLVKTVFASATERDIYTGDKLEIVVLNAGGIHREYMELRKD